MVGSIVITLKSDIHRNNKSFTGALITHREERAPLHTPINNKSVSSPAGNYASKRFHSTLTIKHRKSDLSEDNPAETGMLQELDSLFTKGLSDTGEVGGMEDKSLRTRQW